MDPITLEELAALLKGMASHKAPGPDNVLAETLQWLSKAKRQPLLDLFNNRPPHRSHPTGVDHGCSAQGRPQQLPTYLPSEHLV